MIVAQLYKAIDLAELELLSTVDAHTKSVYQFVVSVWDREVHSLSKHQHDALAKVQNEFLGVEEDYDDFSD